MTAGDLDLLRERRAQLGEAEPDTGDLLRPLLQGALLGGGLLAVALLAAGVMALMNRSTAAEADRLTPIQARFDGLQAQIQDGRRQRLAQEKRNTELAQALLAVRSGSALMEDLRRRAPQGVQFSDVRVEGELLRLKGQASDPQAFARINALQLELQRSPLFDPGKVTLIKASREEPKGGNRDPKQPPGVPPVLFELTAAFRPQAGSADLATLKALGADGMASRVLQLQREGVLR